MKEIVLGLNAYHADSSAAIFVDGILIAATEEERFRRIKHWAGFPSEAITFCLDEVGCTLEEVTAITIGRDPSAKKLNKAAFVLKHPLIAKSLWNQRSANKDDITLLHEQFRLVEPGVDVDMVRGKLRFIEHHRSHLGSAFFPSRFQEAAILSIDGSGDFSTTMLARGKGTQIEVLESLDFPNSVGLFYTAFTQYLGFPHYGDEYKVMGLAPYGNPQYVDKVAQILPLKEGGLFQWPSSHFNLQNGVVSYPDNLPVVAPLFGQKFIDLFGPARQKEDELTQYHMDLAASVQRYTEEVIFHVLRRLHAITGLDRVCIAGGVAQNSVANGKITRNTPFKEVYIPSAGHDAGISMGSAQYHWHHDLGRDRVAPIYSAYTGSQFSGRRNRSNSWMQKAWNTRVLRKTRTCTMRYRTHWWKATSSDGSADALSLGRAHWVREASSLIPDVRMPKNYSTPKSNAARASGRLRHPSSPSTSAIGLNWTNRCRSWKRSFRSNPSVMLRSQR